MIVENEHSPILRWIKRNTVKFEYTANHKTACCNGYLKITTGNRSGELVTENWYNKITDSF